jgi:hypothetical protein
MDVEGSFQDLIVILFRHFLGGNEENKEIFGQDNRCKGRDGIGDLPKTNQKYRRVSRISRFCFE